MKKARRKTIIPKQPRHPLDYRRILEMHEAIVALCRLQVVMGSSTRPDVRMTFGNASIILPRSSDAGSATSAFAITELGHQDYFIARKLSNLRLDSETGSPIYDVGSTDFKIAKVVGVRRTIFTELLYGDTVTYTDDDPANIDNTRTANNGVDSPELQNCLPPYITMATLGFTDTVPSNAQCVVYAKKVPGLTGVFDGEAQLEWIEDAGNTGVRAFAERNPGT